MPSDHARVDLTPDLRHLFDQVARDPALLAYLHQKIEDLLVDFRDDRLSAMCANGLVVREANGDESSVIRISTRMAIFKVFRLLATADDAEVATIRARIAQASEAREQ